MFREVIYFCAELLNYWSMTFWGLKLFAKVYDIHVNENKIVDNVLFALMCLPISLVAAGNYRYVLYSSFLNYIIIIYIYIIVLIINKKRNKISVSIIASYVFCMKLIDLWIVAVVSEVSLISRSVYVNLIRVGIERTIYMVILSFVYYIIFHLIYKNVFIYLLNDNRFYCNVICIYLLFGNGCFSRVYLLNYKESIIGYWTFYLVCSIVLIGGILFYFIEIKGKERERLLNMRNDMMEANYQGLKKAYEANKTLQHDHKSHMLAMYELIKDNKIQEAINYIDMYMDYTNKSFVEIKSGNAILDIIVNSKIDITKEKGIKFFYEIDNLGYMKIQDIDMCALLANLLDNAIEACERVNCERAWILLRITRKGDMLLIKINNSIYPEMMNKKNLFKSEKGNSNLHGWGMKSIERVVNKYGGTKQFYLNNNYIELFITIPI